MMINDNSKSGRLFRMLVIVISSVLALGFVLSYVAQVA